MKRLEQDAVNLEKLSSVWFDAHKHNALSAMLVLYLKEAQSGDLKNTYAYFLDDSLECLISVLPLVANSLANSIMRVRQVPQYRLRTALSLIIYWLIQGHTGKKDNLPESHEMLDIIENILT
ncbi:hypothetical protein [Klebsiella variicola]|uniref:hypothetical protein n=1 Tax=Klebsiella variicola TaxID=244366 RepID=UPI0020054111|nr:hypothetical protein [Klebsiella variicola]MCK6046594.1 hypothetical protein [Klebsiella variicola]HBR0926756.1 hypothetical protein [Klebsiella variicola]HBU5893761.1 hypothetical protein [Klebsiella variicola]